MLPHNQKNVCLSDSDIVPDVCKFSTIQTLEAWVKECAYSYTMERRPNQGLDDVFYRYCKTESDERGFAYVPKSFGDITETNFYHSVFGA